MSKIYLYIAVVFLSSLTVISKENDTLFNKESALSEKKEISKLSDVFYSYTSDDSLYFNVYQKLSEKDSLYTQFKIYHQHSIAKNDNLWRIIEGNIVKFDGAKMIPIQKTLTGGENEFVWRSARPNVGDATGGYHGDERIDIDPNSSVAFYADGEIITYDNEDIDLTACNSFYYHQFSTMHQTGMGASDASKPGYVAIPGNPIDCFHEKKTTFENNGYTTYNKLTWLRETPVKRCNIGLMCVTSEISYQGTNEDNETVVFNNDGAHELTSEKPRIRMENEDATISIVCDAKVISAPFTPQLTTFIWDLKHYHKYYCRLLSPPNTKVGEIWETEASISFSYNK